MTSKRGETGCWNLINSWHRVWKDKTKNSSKIIALETYFNCQKGCHRKIGMAKISKISKISGKRNFLIFSEFPIFLKYRKNSKYRYVTDSFRYLSKNIGMIFIEFPNLQKFRRFHKYLLIFLKILSDTIPIFDKIFKKNTHRCHFPIYNIDIGVFDR